MTGIVLLQAPIDALAKVHVHAGATIERATGLCACQVARLTPDDRFAIEATMTKMARR